MGSERCTYRYRFSVPDKDTIVRDWIEAQDHLSMSLRLLIKEDVLNHGLVDVTCRLLAGMGSDPPAKRRPRQSDGRQVAPYQPVERYVPRREGPPEEDEPEAPAAPRAKAAPGSRTAGNAVPVSEERPEPFRKPEPKPEEKPVPEPEAVPEPASAPAPRLEPVPAPAGHEGRKPSAIGDPMAFLNRTAGASSGTLEMFGLDGNDDEN